MSTLEGYLQPTADWRGRSKGHVSVGTCTDKDTSSVAAHKIIKKLFLVGEL
jgi:hypothetical protein